MYQILPQMKSESTEELLPNPVKKILMQAEA